MRHLPFPTQVSEVQADRADRPVRSQVAGHRLGDAGQPPQSIAANLALCVSNARRNRASESPALAATNFFNNLAEVRSDLHPLNHDENRSCAGPLKSGPPIALTVVGTLDLNVSAPRAIIDKTEVSTPHTHRFPGLSHLPQPAWQESAGTMPVSSGLLMSRMSLRSILVPLTRFGRNYWAAHPSSFRRMCHSSSIFASP